MEISAEQEQFIWRTFAGSPIQRILHERLAELVNTARIGLESAPDMERVLALQAEIRAYRRFAEELHSKDTPSQKAMFNRI